MIGRKEESGEVRRGGEGGSHTLVTEAAARV